MHVGLEKKCLMSNYFDLEKTQYWIHRFLKYALAINLSDQDNRNYFQPQIRSFGQNKFFQLIQESKEDNIFVNNLKEQFELLQSSQKNLTFLDGSVIEMLFQNDENKKRSFVSKIGLNAHFDFICNFDEHQSMIKCFYEKKLYEQISYILDQLKVNSNYHKYISRDIPFIFQNLSQHYDVSDFFSQKKQDHSIFNLGKTFTNEILKYDQNYRDSYRVSDSLLGQNKIIIESAQDQEELQSKKYFYLNYYTGQDNIWETKYKGFIYFAFNSTYFVEFLLKLPYVSFYYRIYLDFVEKVEVQCQEINFEEETMQMNIDFLKDDNDQQFILQDQNNGDKFEFTKLKLLKLFNFLRNNEKVFQKSLFQDMINYLFETSKNLILKYLGIYTFGFAIPFMHHLSQIQHCSHDLNTCHMNDLIPLKQQVSIFWNYMEILKFISMATIQIQYAFILYYELKATGKQIFTQNFFSIFDFAQPLSFFAHLVLCFYFEINQPGPLLVIIIIIRIIIVIGILNRTLKYLKCYQQSCLIYHTIWNTIQAILPSLMALLGFDIIFSILLMIIKCAAEGDDYQKEYSGLSVPIQTLIQIFRLSLRDIEIFQLNQNWKQHGSDSSFNVMNSLIWILWFLILVVNSIVILNLMIVQSFNVYENASEHSISLFYKERIEVTLQIFKILEQQFGIQEKFCAIVIRKPLESKHDIDKNVNKSISEEIKKTTKKQITQLQANLETLIQKNLSSNELNLNNQSDFQNQQ